MGDAGLVVRGPWSVVRGSGSVEDRGHLSTELPSAALAINGAGKTEGNRREGGAG